jgi:hypothetical protein
MSASRTETMCRGSLAAAGWTAAIQTRPVTDAAAAASAAAAMAA